MNSAGRNPMWSRWAWLMITASSSLSWTSAQSSLGYASQSFLEPGWMPASRRTLLSEVSTRKQDRPTSCPAPRHFIVICSDVVNLGLNMVSPRRSRGGRGGEEEPSGPGGSPATASTGSMTAAPRPTRTAAGLRPGAARLWPRATGRDA